MRSRCFNPHCSRVKTAFDKVEEQEISLERDAIVFVRTVPVDGWVYVETQEGSGGYAPMDCLSPILPLVEQNTNEYRPSDAVLPRPNNQELDTVVCVKRRANAVRHLSQRLSLLSSFSLIGSANDTMQGSVSARRRVNPRMSLSIQSSQTDNISLRLLRSILPLYIRSVFSTFPITPYDIWSIEVARHELNIQQPAFQRMLQECGVAPSLFSELTAHMDLPASASFVVFDMGDFAHYSSIFHTVSFPDDAQPVLPKPKSVSHIIRHKPSKKHPDSEKSTTPEVSEVPEAPVAAETPEVPEAPVAPEAPIVAVAPSRDSAASSLTPKSSQKSLLSSQSPVPDRPSLNTPDRPSLNTPDRPSLNTPDRPLLNTPDRPSLNTPDRPSLNTPDRPSLEAPVAEVASVPLSCVYSDLDLYDFTLYASIYFQREKSRLFHTFSPRELVSFTGRIPLQPLHPLPPLLVPVVLDLERKVLMWMNVVMVEESEAVAASAEEQRLAVLEQIVYQSVGSQEVFDEAVCFVMKQSNDNPDPDSEVAGLQCLYVLLRQRRPSPALLKYVLNYLHQRVARQDAVGGLAWMSEKELLEGEAKDASEFHMSRFDRACSEIEEGEDHIIAYELLDSVSLETVLRVEDAARTLLLHGLLPPSGYCYAWHFDPPTCAVTEVAITQMMQALLRGVVVFVRTADARDFKERVLKLDASLLRLVWLPLSGNANKMHSIELEDLNDVVCIGGVIEGEGRERASLYGVQLFARSDAQSVDLAVLSAPERYRLLQFLTSWTRWYKLGLAEVDGGAARGAEGESPLCPDRKRSLEGYLRKQSFTTSQFFSATAADASLATPPMTIKSAGSLGSPLGSPTAQRSRSLKSGTFGTFGAFGTFGSPGSLGAAGGAGAAGGTGAFNTAGAFSTAGTGGSGSRRGLDFSAMSAVSVDALKKTQLLKAPAAPMAPMAGSAKSSETFALHDLMPYPHHAQIPRLLLLLGRALVEREGYKLEGIFRKSPPSDEQHLLSEALSVGNYDAINYVTSGYTLASIIKVFLRHLTPRLVSPSLWDDIVVLGKQENNMDVEKAWELIRTLPEPNFSTLMYLLTFVYNLSLVESNHMSVNSFIIVIGPNLIDKEVPEGADELAVQRAIMNETCFILNYFTVLAATVKDHFDISVFKEDFPFV